jgi:hypothetical protein
MLFIVSTIEVPVAGFALPQPVLLGSLVSCGLCSVLPTPLPEMSRIKFANENSRIPGVRVADRPRFPSPSAVLGPVHASAPGKIDYALSVRHWRHLLDGVDHRGLCRRSATFHQRASLMPKLRLRNP